MLRRREMGLVGDQEDPHVFNARAMYRRVAQSAPHDSPEAQKVDSDHSPSFYLTGTLSAEYNTSLLKVLKEANNVRSTLY